MTSEGNANCEVSRCAQCSVAMPQPYLYVFRHPKTLVQGVASTVVLHHRQEMHHLIDQLLS